MNSTNDQTLNSVLFNKMQSKLFKFLNKDKQVRQELLNWDCLQSNDYYWVKWWVMISILLSRSCVRLEQWTRVETGAAVVSVSDYASGDHLAPPPLHQCLLQLDQLSVSHRLTPTPRTDDPGLLSSCVPAPVSRDLLSKLSRDRDHPHHCPHSLITNNSNK